MNLQELRNTLLAARSAYYHGGNANMSDAEYDRLESVLRSIAPNDPILSMVGAPLPADTILHKMRHPEWAAMGSLFKVNSDLEMKGWVEKLGTVGGFHVSLKGDGATVAIYYEHGKLVRALSRGDGKEGEDITANVAKMMGVVHDLGNGWSGVIRGEAILTVDRWKLVDPELKSNPRNIGNGIMGRKSGEGCEHLSIYAFDAAFDPERGSAVPVWKTESEKFETIRQMGFTTIGCGEFTSLDGVLAWYHDVEASRSSLPFWIDGIVVRYNNLQIQQDAGRRDNRPKGQMAWKFTAEKVETKILSVELSVGHTGAITPVGILEPCQLGGCTISRVMLNNWEEIRRLDLYEGDVVEVIKANDIIPKVVRVVSREDGNIPVIEPEKCPCCGAATTRATNTDGSAGAITICTNADDCPAQVSGKVKRWIKSLDILGVGDTILEALFASKMVTTPADLYRLDVGELANLVINEEIGMRLGDSRASAMIDSIEKTRTLTIPQFMGSLGIKLLGKRRVELMIQGAPVLGESLDPWLDGSIVGEIGAKAGVTSSARAIYDSIRKTAPIIEDLLKVVEISANSPTHPVVHHRPDGGKKVCISGKLPSGKTKKEYAAPLAANGHELVDSVNSNTDILVLADPGSNSSKAVKARKMGIAIIDETELQNYL